MQKKRAEKKTRITHSGMSRGQAAVTDLMSNVSRLMDRRPREVSVIYAAVQDALKGKSVPETKGQRDAFIVSAFAQLYPSLLESKVVKAAMDRIIGDYATLPSTRATRLRKGPAPQSVGAAAHPLVVAAVAGVVIGAVVVGVAILWLVANEDDDDEPSQ